MDSSVSHSTKQLRKGKNGMAENQEQLIQLYKFDRSNVIIGTSQGIFTRKEWLEMEAYRINHAKGRKAEIRADPKNRTKHGMFVNDVSWQEKDWEQIKRNRKIKH